MTASLEHRDKFQKRDDAENDHDNAHDLLGAAIQRQHIDQIKDKDNNEEGNQYADNHQCPLRMSLGVAAAEQRKAATPVPVAEPDISSATTKQAPNRQSAATTGTR
jgi:hypothetical protein